MTIAEALKSTFTKKNILYFLGLTTCLIIGFMVCFFYMSNNIKDNIETMALASLYGYWQIVDNKYCLIDQESITYIIIKPDGLIVDNVLKIKSIKSNKESKLDGNYKFNIILDKKYDSFNSDKLTIDLNYVIGEVIITVNDTVIDTMIKDCEMSIQHHLA